MKNSTPAPHCQYCNRDDAPAAFVMKSWTDGVENVWYCGECCLTAALSESSATEYEPMEVTTPPADDNPTIVDKIAEFITTYVALPMPEQARVLAYWVLHTHAFEGSYATPYIYVNSPEPQCGKTLLIETLHYLARNPMKGENVTTSILFRVMGTDASRPTLFLDEIDATFSSGGKGGEDMRGVLNSGYKHNGQVPRTLPGKNKGMVIDLDDAEAPLAAQDSDVVWFPTYCPKLLAGIDNGKLPATVADRSITITLRRARADQEITRLRPRRVEPIAATLQDEIMEWTRLNADAALNYEPAPFDEVSARQEEITEALLQLAHTLNDEDNLRAALVKVFEGVEGPETPQVKVLRAAKRLFEDTGADRISSNALAATTGLNGKAIGALLKPHGITPGTYRINGMNAKGYLIGQFEDAFSRYL